MKKIVETQKAIKRFKSFIITSHVNPEGDSIGSQLAMAKLLDWLGKKYIIVNSDRVPRHYLFLPGVNSIRNKIGKRNKTFEAAIVLDCPNVKRVGKIKYAVDKAGYIINIDHHVSNENFGSLNWVAKDASSTGEMVYRLYKHLGCRITKEAALCLYISILTDTGSFNYDNTSSATHEIISELMGYGIEPYDVSQSVYESKTVGAIKLLGRALSGIKIVSKGRVAYASIRQTDLESTKTRPSDCENFVNFGRSIKGVNVALFFREDIKKRNLIHVSLRSKKKVDVNKIAAYFGGGGHRKASGCVLRGSLEEVKKKILKKVRYEL